MGHGRELSHRGYQAHDVTGNPGPFEVFLSSFLDSPGTAGSISAGGSLLPPCEHGIIHFTSLGEGLGTELRLGT